MEDKSQDLDFLAGIRIVDFTQFEAGPWLGLGEADIEKLRGDKVV